METARLTDPSNVVNVSVTMIFQCLHPSSTLTSIGAAHTQGAICMRAKAIRRRQAPPLDLDHLAGQCQGDACLQDELLGHFRLQSRALCAQLSEADSESLEAKARIAHKLCGSALAIGAGRVADAARALENELRAEGEPTPARAKRLSRATTALTASVAEAIAEIERIRTSVARSI
jgi:HPt (histidine-containing phosphotransfer) domain-containing protein